MYLFLLLLFLAAAVITALFIKPVAVTFLLDTNQMDMHAAARWSLFRIEARIIDYRVFITVFIFGKKIYAGYMKQRKKGRKGKALYDSLEISNTRAKISYGFNEPYLTGVFCAAADFAAALIRTADIELEPEFIPENEFLKITAETHLNAGKTFINMLRSNLQNARGRKNYGRA